MNGEHDAILSFAIAASMIIIGVSIALATFRLFRGPTLPDRVVALDLVGTIAVGVIAVYAIAEHKPVFLNVSMVLALLMFIGTVAFAFYLHKGAKIPAEPPPNQSQHDEHKPDAPKENPS